MTAASVDHLEAIEIGGWDRVIRLPLDVVNDALAALTERHRCEFSFTQPNEDGGLSIDGIFGAWTIEGGVGQNLTLKLPVFKGTLTVAASPESLMESGRYSLDGAVVRLTLKLDFAVPLDRRSKTDLRFAFVDCGVKACAFERVHPSGLTVVPQPLHSAMAGVLSEAVAKCLSANYQDVILLFAGLAPEITPAGDGLAYIAFAFATDADEQTSMLVFYATRLDTSLDAQISGLPEIGRHGITVVFSQRAFLEDILVPALATGIHLAQTPFHGIPGGPGPVLQSSKRSPDAVDPAVFDVSMETPRKATIRAKREIEYQPADFSSAQKASLCNFRCDIDGGDLAISCDIKVYLDVLLATIPITSSLTLRFRAAVAGSALMGAGTTEFRMLPMGVAPASAEPGLSISALMAGVMSQVTGDVRTAFEQAFAQNGIPVTIKTTDLVDFVIESARLDGALMVLGRIKDQVDQDGQHLAAEN